MPSGLQKAFEEEFERANKLRKATDKIYAIRLSWGLEVNREKESDGKPLNEEPQATNLILTPDMQIDLLKKQGVCEEDPARSEEVRHLQQRINRLETAQEEFNSKKGLLMSIYDWLIDVDFVPVSTDSCPLE